MREMPTYFEAWVYCNVTHGRDNCVSTDKKTSLTSILNVYSIALYKFESNDIS